MVHVIEMARLRPGDVILTRNAEGAGKLSGVGSKAIQVASGGDFSHAMICSLAPTCVEAIPGGVLVTSLQRCFAHDLSNVRVLRYPDQAIAAKAAGNAQRQVGRGYSIGKAAASVFPERIVDEIRNRGIFCSALIAQAFVEAGAREFEATPVQKSTPATLQRMACLRDATAELFMRVLSPPNIESMSPLDGDRAQSMADEQSRITRRYADALSAEASELSRRYPSARLAAPDTFYQMVQFVIDAMDAIRLVPSGDRGQFSDAVRAIDTRAAAMLDSGELSDLSQRIIAADEAEYQRNLAESTKPNPDIDRRSLESFHAAAVEQLSQRASALDGYKMWGPDKSRLVASWIRHQESTFPFFERRLVILAEIIERLEARQIDSHHSNV